MKKNKIEPIKIALIAVGGDGGGVLTQWIVKIAEKNNYWAQSTTIAGVAQRTGSTVYYIELYPLANLDVDSKNHTPILAQMPEIGTLDMVVATEIMEAGRAVQRGFVSKATTLIFSTHRNLAVQEKEVTGDGILKGEEIFNLATKYAKKCLFANYKIIAEKNHSVISASLFGAIAASNVLNFSKQDFENTIQQSGVAVESSLNAFRDAYSDTSIHIENPKEFKENLRPANFIELPSNASSQKMQQVIDDIKQIFPQHLQPIVFSGVKHLIEWQNIKWANKYISHLKKIIEIDKLFPNHNFFLTENVARYLAIAMAYDDLVNVADIKTRAERWTEVRKQVDAKPDDIVQVLDYLHPRLDEIAGFLPVKIGRWIGQNKNIKKFFTKYLDKDRRMTTSNLLTFSMLYIIGGMRSWRMISLRHHEEMDNINAWLNRIEQSVQHNYLLAVQIAKTYRLKKGYGDTYARGDSKFKSINELAMTYQHNPQIHEQIEHLIQFGLKNHDMKKINSELEIAKAKLITHNS